ncbi:MAG: hypothetical protein IH924_01285 [Proteobacteria bacterium]|nr:hypothetical protein [Pseudomonadota bacterium]
MSLPSDVPELATPSEAAADEAEVARCLEEAARMVQNFADAGGTAALVALLATAEEDPGPAAERALGLAKTVTKQTETLHGEVARFLTTTQAS